VHARDIARFIDAFARAPRIAAVYNIGGGKPNSCSILEAFELVASFTGRKQVYTYVEETRRGDHVCYFSDLRKMKADYPDWDITMRLDDTVREIVETWHARISG